jgi:hypothetical protein
MLLVVSDLEATGGRDADLAYMRVADDIAARIASGELKPGARLRAERELKISSEARRHADKWKNSQNWSVITLYGPVRAYPDAGRANCWAQRPD